MTNTAFTQPNTTTTPAAHESALKSLIRDARIPCAIEHPDGTTTRYCDEALFTLHIRTWDALKTPPNQLALANAYLHGDFDISGDFAQVMAIRDLLPGGTTPRQAARFLWDLCIAPATSVNRAAIDSHYTLGDDFYHTFIDRKYHFYSQCLFDDPSESLEQAAEHKLERMWDALQLRPGDRLLDIGAGWGGVGLYCARRGVNVTAITLAADSARYMRELYRAEGLDVSVIQGDFLTYQPEQPFDHAVIYGVIEHLPNYAKFSTRTWELLKPNGQLYLDGSASIDKFAVTGFTRKYIWPGHHTFMSLPGVQQALLRHGFDILGVDNETKDYALTMRHWATRFDAASDNVIGRWGEETYRKFRIYLWAGAHALETNRLQAYHMVAARRHNPGPRPSIAMRTAIAIAAAVG